MNPTHLFISYASEDGVLAKWLARKLAALGYAVWFDQLKMLGGEPWPQTIDDAIKNRTFRMLGLISAHSLHKPKPTGERVLAQKIAEQRSIPDFMIPLKVDGTELDWLTTAISYVPFNRGWADGWRQLLKKLDSISAPKTLVDARSLAATTFPTGDDLITSTTEQLRSNVIRVEQLPAALRVFKIAESVTGEQMAKLGAAWAFYRINGRLAFGFTPPPKNFEKLVTTSKEQWSWADFDTLYDIRTRDVIANLIVRSLKVRLLSAGCCIHPKRDQTIYLPENFTEDGWLRFPDFRGKNSRLKIRGKATFKRVGKPPEINHHHFAFRLRLGKGLDKSFWVQVTPSLFFFDGAEQPIIDARVGPRRKRVAKSWFNAKWVNRLLAAEYILLDVQTKSNDGIVLANGFHTLEAPLTLNELPLAEKGATAEAETTDEDGEFDLRDEDEKESG